MARGRRRSQGQGGDVERGEAQLGMHPAGGDGGVDAAAGHHGLLMADDLAPGVAPNASEADVLQGVTVCGGEDGSEGDQIGGRGDIPVGASAVDISRPGVPGPQGKAVSATEGRSPGGAGVDSASPRREAPGGAVGRLAAVRASAIGLRPPKNAGHIRLLGAPSIDLAEAKRQLLEDRSLAESPEMGELSRGLAAAAGAPDGRSSSPEREVLDTADEETFTLETFESLIRTARASEKTFLLARVTTVDPKDLTRLYYSYYSAHQINKVIFRTQPEEGLLHRMKSRNPLNNMLIVGDVHYFALTPEEFDRAWAAAGGPLAPTAETAVASQSSVGLLSGARASTHSLGGASLVYEAKFFATDDDFLMRTDIRDYFRKNSVQPDDYQLFQLHRRAPAGNPAGGGGYGAPYEMTILGPDGRPLLHGSQHAPEAAADGDARPRPSRLRTLCGLLNGGRHRSLVGLPTGFLSPVGFWLLMLLTAGAVVAVTLLLLTAPIMYFCYGGFGAFFCLVLLFLVDWTDN